MNKNRFPVVAEINELEELLSTIPKERVIERMSLEARLKAAQDLLAVLPETKEAPKARLTFRGKPVLGTHGILANFGAKAVDIF
ncbi:MAG: hypothetical protein PHU72_10325, partial [Dethiosulfovibrio sp.]|nr:hypothetical protein [Dethiosulfovibrio sp.]